MVSCPAFGNCCTTAFSNKPAVRCAVPRERILRGQGLMGERGDECVKPSSRDSGGVKVENSVWVSREYCVTCAVITTCLTVRHVSNTIITVLGGFKVTIFPGLTRGGSDGGTKSCRWVAGEVGAKLLDCRSELMLGAKFHGAQPTRSLVPSNSIKSPFFRTHVVQFEFRGCLEQGGSFPK